MKNQVRSFIALEISSRVRSKISRYLDRHVTDLQRVKWVTQDQFHLTLKFLGDVPMNQMHQVITAIKTACAQTDPFDLVFEGIGAFPDKTDPRTLWIGVTEGTEESVILAEMIDTELAKLGFPRETRRLTPHLTIGRVKRGSQGDSAGIGALMLPEKEPPFFGVSAVDAVTLFASELSRRGPKYAVLAEIDLRTIG
ncbi:MAG: RNA 2',3'-cyclic phosphodiesterase [Thermoguttaceae bacterium]|jgi:2'-5' RNA ligase